VAGHVDLRQLIEGCLDMVWDITNDLSEALRDGAKVVNFDPARFSLTLQIRLRPPLMSSGMGYFVERIQEREQCIVFARRWGNPHFIYSHAIWIYKVLPGRRTELRCVQDFALSSGSTLDQEKIEQAMARSTAAGMRRAAERVRIACQNCCEAGCIAASTRTLSHQGRTNPL
jgi:hypothetical protein